MIHYLPSSLLNGAIQVALIGAGGTGSRVLEQLVNLNRAMVALGHPGGLNVTWIDDDIVSEAHVGRQAFDRSDVGQHKASVLINRANMALGDRQWRCELARVSKDGEDLLRRCDLVIGAVYTRKARASIVHAIEHANAYRDYGTYYLDTGNRANDGQVILGQVMPLLSKRQTKQVGQESRLPHIGELFPELVDPQLDSQQDDMPSCSLAEALTKQSLFVNPAMSLFAMNLLWQLFTKGKLEHHGAFINLETSTVRPLPICKETWKRFGVNRDS